MTEAAQRAGQFYVTNRWMGGTLTNFKTIKTSVDRLRKLEEILEKGEEEGRSKRELLQIDRERQKLENALGGIKEMKKVPGAIFVVDPLKERIAVHEARLLHIPVIAVVDTNCDPDGIDYLIPGNDDALRSIKLFCDLVADTCLEGAKLFEDKARREGAEKPTPPPLKGGPAVEKVARAGKPEAEATAIPEEVVEKIDYEKDIFGEAEGEKLPSTPKVPPPVKTKAKKGGGKAPEED